MSETYMDLERERIAKVLEQTAASLELLAASVRVRHYSNDSSESPAEEQSDESSRES